MNLVLDWAVLSISFFNTICLFWLGLMVLLAGNRRSAGTWLTGGGLLFGALFFTSHTAILGRGLGSTTFGMDFWWWVSWTPAAAAPFSWYAAMLWYAGYRIDRPHRHHSWLVLVIALAAAVPLLLIFANPLPSYQYVAGRILINTPAIAGIPLLILVYIAYSLLCYLLPVDLLLTGSSQDALKTQSRRRARPWLVGASLALLLAGILLAWTAFWAVTSQPLPSLNDSLTEQTVKRFDLAVEALVSLAVTLLGRTIVGFEVFTGRSLPRNRFFRQWRSTVILAAGFGASAAWTLTIELRPIYSLMLATALMTLFYALYSWRSFRERDEFMANLRPFVASQNLFGQMTGLQQNPEGNSQPGSEQHNRGKFDLQFESLCRDILDVQAAVLLPRGALATMAGPPLIYPASGNTAIPLLSTNAAVFTADVRCLPAVKAGFTDGYDWAVPLWSHHGLDGVLLLGKKTKQNPFTEEEIEIAQAAGERLLDMLAGVEMTRLALSLLRQRLAQARVIDGQGRRVLHDEILPELHTALLYLSSLQRDNMTVQQVNEILAGAHRRIAELMREMPLSVPHRLVQGGLIAALQSMLQDEFKSDFCKVIWEIQAEAEQRVRSLPLFIHEVLFFALREIFRNAAVHGRGEDPARLLCLKIALIQENGLCICVEDNGVGFHPGIPGASSGSGNGLRIHSALLAAVGTRLELLALPGSGTRAELHISDEGLPRLSGQPLIF